MIMLNMNKKNQAYFTKSVTRIFPSAFIIQNKGGKNFLGFCYKSTTNFIHFDIFEKMTIEYFAFSLTYILE